MDNEKYPLALREGSVLAGQYIIQKVLGQGGFGITYMAVDHKSGQKVAVKEFFPDTLATRTQNTVMSYEGERTDSFNYGKACFLQEAETLAAFIGNENIVRIHSYFEENSTAYFVMDFVEGISFDEYIRQNGGKVSYEDAERVLLPVIDALALVHSRGIVHRDVTPDNIYITNAGTVKLLDFGAARYSLGDKSRSLDVVLKHGFAPKEQYTRHGRQGPYTDVYTVGASFYYAITGKRPPDSIDRLEDDNLIPPSSLGVKIEPQKEEAILKAMSVRPEDRFQNMEAFKRALVPDAENMSAADSLGVTNQRIFTAQQPSVTQSIQQPQQSVTQIPQEPQQPTEDTGAKKKKRKKRIFIGAGIAAALIAVIAMISGGDDENNSVAPATDHIASSSHTSSSSVNANPLENYQPVEETQSAEETMPEEETQPVEETQSAEETQPVQTESVYECVLGNTPDNIANSAFFASDGENLLWTTGHSIKCSDGTEYGDGIFATGISCIDDFIYYVDRDYCLYRIDRTDGSIYKVSELTNNGEKRRIITAYILPQYNINIFYDDDVNGENGALHCMTVDKKYVDGISLENQYQVTFIGDYIYYVASTEEGKDIIGYMPVTDWSTCYMLTKPDDLDSVEILSVYTDDEYLYVVYINTEDRTVVAKVNPSTGEIIKTISSSSTEFISFNVCDGCLYYTASETQDDGSIMYYLKKHEFGNKEDDKVLYESSEVLDGICTLKWDDGIVNVGVIEYMEDDIVLHYMNADGTDLQSVALQF